MHYGVSVQWGPNTLIYNTAKVRSLLTGCGLDRDSGKYKGKVTVPDNPIQIADAALYLMKTNPSLGIESRCAAQFEAQFKAQRSRSSRSRSR